MELTIPKAELTRGLFLTQSIVEKRTTMPILVNVLMTATDKGLQIASTDLEITAQVLLNASVKKRGATTVNAKVLSDIVKELPEQDIHIKLGDGERLEIQSGKSKIRIIGISSEEYPGLPGLSLDVKGSLDAQQLEEMIHRTIFAVSQDETRYNLSGVCFELQSEGGNKFLTMAATDGHRLSLIRRPVKNISFKEKVIVPRKGLLELKKLLDLQEGGMIGVSVQEGFLIVEAKDCKLSIRLIDGEFPEYNQVIPKEVGERLEVRSEDFTQALKRVSLMVSDKSKCVRLDVSKGLLRISSSSPELGDAKEELAVEYNGPDLTAGFNARYLLEFLSTVEGNSSVVIELNGETGPAKIKAPDDESHFGIVMPMRLV